MKYTELKKQFIELKKEKLEYIIRIIEIRNNRLLTDTERLKIYRKIIKYQKDLDRLLKEMLLEYRKIIKEDKKKYKEFHDDIVIIEINIDKKITSLLEKYKDYFRERFLETLRINIDNLKYQLTTTDLRYISHGKITKENIDLILGGQPLLDKELYCYDRHIYVNSEYDITRLYDEFGVYALYYDIAGKYKIVYGKTKELLDKEIKLFEQDKIMFYENEYVKSHEIIKIFNEEILTDNNETIDECIEKTKQRVDKLTIERNPKYKEEKLLERINYLYQKIKGKCISKEILYSGSFLDIIKETYKLPNGKTIIKEKIVKNKGKDSVLVIGVTPAEEYLLTFQNRIENELIVEFPAGYIEQNETPITAAKRELEEETGYISNNLVLVDEAYSIVGIDNSKTYIVIADDCIKKGFVKTDGNELVNYDLFSKSELDYLFYNNYIKGVTNKLAYYTLTNWEIDHEYKDGKKIKVRKNNQIKNKKTLSS